MNLLWNVYHCIMHPFTHMFPQVTDSVHSRDRERSETCASGLAMPLLRLSVSPWQAVNSELGRIERKSLKDLLRTPSVSTHTRWAGGGVPRGKSCDRRGSSPLPYRPKARVTPRRHGTTYLHRYTAETPRQSDQCQSKCVFYCVVLIGITFILVLGRLADLQ